MSFTENVSTAKFGLPFELYEKQVLLPYFFMFSKEILLRQSMEILLC